MPSPRAFSDEDVSKLTCRLELGLKGMIRIIEPAAPSTIHRESLHPSLGRLNKLPPELLLLTFDLLDFRSLSRFSRVSLKAKEVIESLPTYQQIMHHAPMLLTAMGKTRLLSFYSGPTVLQTLRSDRCVSCHEFAGFIFLPTCERICFECLRENVAFWMISTATAKQCFCLTDRQLKTIPMTYTIPGTYSVGTPPARRNRSYRLVSVKQAKQLANKLHGSPERVETLNSSTGIENRSLTKSRMFQRFREVSLEAPSRDLSKLPGRATFGGDFFAGVASIRVPCLSGTELDWGRVCRGCRVTNTEYDEGRLPASILSELVPPGVHAYRPLEAMQTRLHSKEDFLEHIKQCHGARLLLME